MITRTSSHGQVLNYLKDKCPSLIKTYDEEIFKDLDGEVFLGLTPASVDMVFPQLSQRDKGLLLARSEYLRSTSSPKIEERDVTPPPNFARTTLGLPPTQTSPDPKRPIGRLDEGRFQSSYRRDFSPVSPSRRRPSPVRSSDQSVAPMVGDLPRILIELWRSTDHPDRDEFLAESWLPDLREIELKPQSMRLALRRSVQRKEKVAMTRPWLGALVVNAKYFRIGNRLELSVLEAKNLNVATTVFSNLFLKVYVYVGGKEPSLSQVHETSRRDLSTASSVEFGEEIILRFNEEGGQNFDFKKMHAETHAGLKSPEIARDLMLRSIPSNDEKLSLYDLMVFVGKGELNQLNPKNNRFDSYLLPTHEISALTGSEFMFKSIAQIEFLKRDSDYMRSHTHLIDLLLLSWGLVDESQGSWPGDSWLFRLALLSSILLNNRAGFRALSAAANTLIHDRVLEMDEDGFGEAVFTLHGDLEAARKFWQTPQRRTGIRSPNLPDQRMTVKALLAWDFSN